MYLSPPDPRPCALIAVTVPCLMIPECTISTFHISRVLQSKVIRVAAVESTVFACGRTVYAKSTFLGVLSISAVLTLATPASIIISSYKSLKSSVRMASRVPPFPHRTARPKSMMGTTHGYETTHSKLS